MCMIDVFRSRNWFRHFYFKVVVLHFSSMMLTNRLECYRLREQDSLSLCFSVIFLSFSFINLYNTWFDSLLRFKYFWAHLKVNCTSKTSRPLLKVQSILVGHCDLFTTCSQPVLQPDSPTDDHKFTHCLHVCCYNLAPALDIVVTEVREKRGLINTGR